MKKLFSYCIICLCLCSVFSLAHKEPGRDSITASLSSGKIPSQTKIDSTYYLDDFAFPYRAQKNEPLSFFVHTNKTSVLTNGEELTIQVGLRANNSEFFAQRDVNYILYITNPEFAATERGKTLFQSALTKMLENKTPSSRLCVFSQESLTLKFITSNENISSVLESVGNSKKADKTETVLLEIGKQIELNSNNLPWRVMIISDEDMFKTKEVKDAFSYIPCMFSNVDFSFSYAGYGIISDWPEINTLYETNKGNIYYEKTYKALENRIISDFDKFMHESISNIQVRISYPEWLGAKDKIYNISAMEYDGHAILLDTINLPSKINLSDDLDDTNLQIGLCSVMYDFGANKTSVYKTTPVAVTYTEDIVVSNESINKIVQQSKVFNNSGIIFEQLEQLCNTGNYSNALLLINDQIIALKELQLTSKDRQIEVDIQNFKKAEEIILDLILTVE